VTALLVGDGLQQLISQPESLAKQQYSRGKPNRYSLFIKNVKHY